MQRYIDLVVAVVVSAPLVLSACTEAREANSFGPEPIDGNGCCVPTFEQEAADRASRSEKAETNEDGTRL